jgi:O-antigen ligase
MTSLLSSLKNRLYWLSAILFILPFSITFSSYIISGLAIISLIQEARSKDRFAAFRKPSFWILSSLFLLTVSGLLYSSNLGAGFKTIEAQVGMLALPFIFSHRGISPLEVNKVKRAFIIFLVALCLALEFRVIHIVFASPYEFFGYLFHPDNTYENLTGALMIQPVYLGVYIVLANIFCLSLASVAKSSATWAAYCAALVFNSFFLLQLAVRGPIIINTILVALYVCIIFYKKRRLLAGVAIVIGVLIGTGAVLSFTGFTRVRMEWFLNELSGKNLKTDNPTSRMLIWPCAFEVVKHHPVFGVGTGDSEDHLMGVYKERGLNELYESGLNAHNQYLTIAMRHGVLGLIFFLLNLGLQLYVFIRARMTEAILFSALILGFFVTENVLSRAHGVIFYAFFGSIFLVIALNSRQNENPPLRNQLSS